MGNNNTNTEIDKTSRQIIEAETMTGSFFKRIIREHSTFIAVSFLLVFLLEFVFYVLEIRAYSYPSLFLIVFYLYAYRFILRGMRQKFMEQFAKRNGFEFVLTDDIKKFDGNLGKVGHSRAIYNFISGKSEADNMFLFNCQYTIGYGKGSTDYFFTVFRFDFVEDMPVFLLENSEDYIYGNGIAGLERLSLEGNFDDHFTLYVTKEFEIEALQIFTPEVMEFLIKKASAYSLEIVENHLYIYENNLISSQKEMDAYYEVVNFFRKIIFPRIKKIDNSVSAMNDVINS